MKLLYNARIVNEGRIFPGYLVINGAFIEKIGSGDFPNFLNSEFEETIDLGGRYLLPGAIDEHVHFRDPGLTYKGDMESESRAAVAGGVTSFIDMPNTSPASTTQGAVEDKMRRAAEVAWANYGFFIGATADNLSELLSADYDKIAGIKLFLGSSTGKMAVSDPEIVNAIFEKAPALIAVHAEDDEVIAENKRKLTEVIGENGGDWPVEMHSRIRDERACLAAAERAVDLARRYDARLHIMHISTGAELRLLSPGPVTGKRITAETCPQYLLFNEGDYASRGGMIKCNPSIKNFRDELLRALSDTVIDCVGSDHAPHLLKEKEGGALKAVSGMPGVGHSLPVMMDFAAKGKIAPERVVQVMCHNPALLFGIDRRGFLREGYYADLVVVDCDSTYEVRNEECHYKCGWSPLNGMTLGARVAMTFVNGEQAFPFTDVRPKALPLLFKGNKR